MATARKKAPEEEPQEEVQKEVSVDRRRSTIIKCASALSLLIGRSLPSLDSEMKAGRLHQLVNDRAELIQKAKNKKSNDILKDHRVEDLKKMSPLLHEKLAGEIAVDQGDFDQEDEPEWEWPPWKITKSDLPKEKSGEEGWKNGAGLGAIMSGLGPLFDWTDWEAQEAKKKKE